MRITIFLMMVFFLNAFSINAQKAHKDSTQVFTLLTKGYKRVYENPRFAAQKVDSAISISKSENYAYGLMKSFNISGIVYDILGKNDSALQQYRKGLSIANSIKDSLQIARTYNNVGLIHWNQHRLDSALFYYKIATEVFKNLNSLPSQANGYNNLGLIYDDIEKDEEAKKYFLKALKIYKSIGDTFGMGSSLLNLGRLYFDKPDSCKKYSYSAIPHLKKSNDLYGLSRVYNNLASAYESLNQYDSSYAFFLRSLAVKEKTNDTYGIASTLNNFYSLYNEPGQTLISFSTMEKYLKRAKKIALAQDYTRIQYLIYENLKFLYAGKQMLDSAYYYLQLEFESYKVIYNKEKEEKIQELEVQFEIERKESMILSLEKTKEIERLKAERRKNYLLWLVVVFTLLALGGSFFFLYFKNKQKLKYQSQLAIEKEKGLKATIIATEEERKRIAKDLHDGVGQQLAALKLHFSKLSQDLKSGNSLDVNELTLLTEIVDNTAQDVRSISHKMMPRALQEKGLVPAIEQLLETTLSLASIEYSFEHFNIPNRFEERIEIAIYRILQELVKNIIKHSKATETAIQLIGQKNRLLLIVEDNGVGITNNNPKGDGIGLLSLRSRVSDINGEINFEPSPTSGTLVTARIPLK